jgi:Tat protein translocase TatB subunit
MFGLGMGEIMVILVVALLVLGPKQLPDAAKKIGQAIRELRKHTQNLQETIEQDEHIGGTVRELKSALRGDEPIVQRPRVPPPIPLAEGEGPVAQGEADKAEKPAEPPADKPAETVAEAKPAETVAEAKPAEPAPPAKPEVEPVKHG